MQLASLDRRKFLRGVSGFALALPALETFAKPVATNKKRFASFYMPDGVPMPLKEDPAFQDWSWFPHGRGREFQFTKCLEPLEPLRNEVTIISGMSHPAVRNVHGHSNADQFLTGANTGGSGEYRNSISLDQVFAEQVGQHTRFSSLVLSTDGGTGSPRGTQTMSFNRRGRAIPAEHRPKRIFDQLFVKSDNDAALRLAHSQSALDDLLADARDLKRRLSRADQKSLDDYVQSVRDTEVKVEKARKWLQTPLPKVDVDHLQLDIGPDDPRNYLQAMFELIFLAFKTDSTRVITYQIGRENGVGASDYLARAVGHTLTHKLTHDTKKPGGWKNFGTYCSFLAEEYGRFIAKLKDTPETAGSGSMLDNTQLLFGSASSAFHLSRNYPLIFAGGRNMGFKHGQYLKYGSGNEDNQADAGIRSDAGWRGQMTYEELPLAKLYLTMLQRLGVETDSFAGCIDTLPEV